MKLIDLQKSSRILPTPLNIELNASISSLEITHWLRILPQKRYVGSGLYCNHSVVAKLLAGSKAERNFEREVHGAKLLSQCNVPTPKLVDYGLNSKQDAWLLFETLPESLDLGSDQFCNSIAVQEMTGYQKKFLQQALIIIARMHRHGVYQEDLHLDNFLISKEILHIIDGGSVGVEVFGKSLSKNKVISNLSLFFAQFPMSFDKYIDDLLIYYIQENNQYNLPLDIISKRVTHVRQWRLRKYIQKVQRDCSAFAVQKNASFAKAMVRDDEKLLEPLLEQIESLFLSGKELKNGNSSTVVQLSYQGRNLLVKRYNIKSFWHGLRRAFKPSRAWHSWVEGYRLIFFGIATAKPLAVLEKRFLGMRREAYLITEYLEGEDALTRFDTLSKNSGHCCSTESIEIKALKVLFLQLHNAHISHGDMKGTNLLWQNNHWFLIDLDSTQQHYNANRFAAAYAKDRQRFLANWIEEDTLYQTLKYYLL